MSDKPEIKNEPKQVERGSMTNEEVSKLIANAVAEALKVAIPAAAVGIAQANTQAAHDSKEKIIREAMKKVQRCPICLLPVSACGGPYAKNADGTDKIEKDKDGGAVYRPELNHIRFFCGPREESLFKWFQGVIISNVRFLADYPGHMQWIPKKSDIPYIIGNWERNEKELSQKREAQGQGAGRLAPGGAIPGTQGALGWR